jgi:8-oxo-dGTP diphosphatase
MKRVAKIVIIDNKNRYLLMQRSNHPTFSNDPDLPGGTVEEGESSLDAMLREVVEEAGFLIDREVVKKLYSGTEYSAHHTHYSLYFAKLTKRPEVIISWEHSSYNWLDRDFFLDKAKNAKDTYMHMVHDVMLNNNI